MARWFHMTSEAKAKGAVLRVVAAICLWNLVATHATAFEKSESTDVSDPAELALSSSGLAGLASIQSAVQEVAAMKWNGTSNTAVSETEAAAQAAQAAAAAKKDSAAGADGETPKNSFLPPGALNIIRSNGGTEGTTTQGSEAAAKEASTTAVPASSSSSTSTSSPGSASNRLSLNMPNSEADRLRRMSDRINGSMGTMGGVVKDAQDRNKTVLNPSGQDKKMNEGGTPIDRDAASKSKFGASGDLSLNSIADNRTKEDDPFEQFLKDQKKKQAGKDKEKSEEEKKKEEKERKELTEKITELANKPPPFTLQDYYDFRDLIAKKNKALGDVTDEQPEFAKKAQTIFDEFSSRDGDEAKKSAFRSFVEESRERELFQNPIIVDPNTDTHRVGASH